MLAAFSVMIYSMNTSESADTIRTLTFSTVVMANLGLILVNRSWEHAFLNTLKRKNTASWWVVGGAFSFLVLAITMPFLQKIFHFSTISFQQFLMCALAAIGGVIWFEWYKLLKRKRT